MNRFFKIIIAGVMFVVLSSLLFSNRVTIAIDMPDFIEAGTEITVNVTIKKGSLTGHARFQQILPVGFTATSDYSAHGIFNFQDQKVTLIWISLPGHDEITFSYKIIANERLTGKIDLEGEFGYIDNNEKSYVYLSPRLLAINPSPNINPAMQIDVNDYAKFASIESEALGSGQTVAFRQRPAWLEEDKVYLVTVLINKDAVKKFAKIEETVPAGYVAAELESKGGIFSFNNQVASIIWMDLPLEPYFTVTYKLIPIQGSPAASMNIKGLFTFMVSDRTFETDIIERSEILAGLTRQQLNALLEGANIRQREPQYIVDQPKDPPPPDGLEDIPKQPPPPPVRQNGRGTSIGNFLLEDEEGIYYRVQIAAGHREVNIPQTFRRYRIQYDIKREEHDGWYKYTTGTSFTEYRDARDFRVQLSNTNKVEDAFVAAYNNGKRITVQDALMALNQSWVP